MIIWTHVGRMLKSLRGRRVRWHHYGMHPLEWIAGPRAIRAKTFHAARKPWNRPRRKVR